MTTKIGLIADVHAYPEPLAEALALFYREEVDIILCAGDIAGYGEDLEKTVGLLIEYQCQSVIGNHDLWHLDETHEEDNRVVTAYLAELPAARQLSVEGRDLYLVHARPPFANRHGIKLLDEYGVLMPDEITRWSEKLKRYRHDVLVVGHTHQVFAEQIGRTLVINPGSTQFNHSCGILHLPDLWFESFALSEKKILKSWNWSFAANGNEV